MKASELINKLIKEKELVGDKEIVFWNKHILEYSLIEGVTYRTIEDETYIKLETSDD